MKKFTTLVCCIFATVLFAQTNTLDNQLSNIDQSSVSSGIIYERVLKLSNFYNFNQTKDFETASSDYFAQVLSEMHRASNGRKFISAEDFKQFEATQPQTNTADLAILSTQYHIMNYDVEDAANGGLIFDELTEKFELMQDKTPFYMLHNTVIAPNKSYLVGETAVFTIDNSLYFTNGTKTIISLIADFGDGIERTIIGNGALIPDTITISYDKSGEKKIKFSIIYSDETTLTTFGKFNFYLEQDFVAYRNGSCGEPEPKEDDSIQANVTDAFTGFNSGDFPIKGLINYRTFYSTANGNTSKTLRNPVILIDGFDPKNTRKIEDCDCAANPECLDKNKSGDIFDPKKHLSIVDAMGYYNPVLLGPDSVLTNLRANGFDVIIVDQPSWEILHPTIPTKVQYNPRTWSYETVPNIIKVDGGADYVERNAMALVALLKNVKAKVAANGSNSQTVIFGPSMGGLISRYALAYMEKKFAQTGNNDWKHNTKLWVSIDSPHLGANVPMGDQTLLDHVKNSNNDARIFYDEKLTSPAAQEMLIEQHRKYNGDYNVAHPDFLNAQTIGQNMPQNRGNAAFQQHFINQKNNGVINSNGFPMDVRKIALTNGSLTGSRNTVNIIGQQTSPFSNDGEPIINMRGFQRINIPITIGIGFLSYTFHITIRTLIGVLESYNMPATGTNARLSRFKAGFSDVTTQGYNANTRGCMDNVPGGFYNAQEQIASPVLDRDPINEGNFNTSALLLHSISTVLGGSYWDVHAYNPRHSFIPTFSSLAHLQPNQNWNNSLNVNLACASNKQTPFDSYYGEANNSEHTSFNKGMVDYLMKELGNPRTGIPPSPQAPHFPINESDFSGPTEVCTTATYSFPDICKIPSAVTWNVSWNLQIVSQTATSIIVNKIGSGTGFVKATFQNGQSLIKNVWVGVPIYNNFEPIGNQSGYNPLEPNISYGTSEGGCNATSFKINFNSPSILEYQWEKLSTSQVNLPTSSPTGFMILTPQCNELLTFKVRARNSCGWSEWQQFDLPLSRCTNDCVVPGPTPLVGANFILNPNPLTDGLLNISIKQNAPWFYVIVPGGLTDENGLPIRTLIPRIRVNIVVYNITLTQQLITVNNSPMPVQLNLSNLQPGTYIVVLEYQGQLESYTIIKN